MKISMKFNDWNKNETLVNREYNLDLDKEHAKMILTQIVDEFLQDQRENGNIPEVCTAHLDINMKFAISEKV
jgi:Fe-S cluster biosynthesis and repair protein YggX